MNRNHSTLLNNWIKEPSRKPLVIRGARQVGKSTLVRDFCKSQNLQILEVNFEITKLNSLNKTQEFNIDLVLEEIEIKTKKTLKKQPSLIFFDEIQSSPEALQALRYFYEFKPDLPVIATGSLLELILEDHQFSMPVGRVQYVHMSPMTFFEFLEANQETSLSQALNSLDPSRWQIHFEKLNRLLKEYFYVGGMPEAVFTFIKTKDFEKVKQVHRSIVQTYKSDFPKYKTKTNLEKLTLFFEKIPAHMGHKIKYSAIMESEKAQTVEQMIRLFIKARILLPCYHSDGSGLPLTALKSETIYKLYFLDIGLYHHMMEISHEDILHGPSLLTDGLSAEQFIAQHLAFLPSPYDEPKLFYWLKDGKSSKAELDFLISQSQEIIPIEIKSGKSGKLKSLYYFMGLKKIKLAIKFGQENSKKITEEISTKSITPPYERYSFKLLKLPLFQIENLYSILSKIQK